MIRSRFITVAGLVALLIAPTLAAAQSDKPVDVSGEWERTVETPGGNFTSTMKLEKQGDTLSGVTVRRDGTETALKDVKLAGRTLTFSQDVTFNGMDLHLAYTGTVDGDTIKGTFEGGGQTMNWSAKRASAVAASGAVSAAGTWKLSVETPNGTRERTVVLKQDGEKLTGTATGPNDQSVPLEDVSLKGKELRFTLSFDRNGQTVKRTYVATLTGDTLSGTIEGGNQSRSFTGKRDAPTTIAVAGPAGVWKLTVQASDQTYHPTVTLLQQGDKWTGKFAVDQGMEEPLKDLTVKGNQLDFKVDLQFNGMEIHLTFSGTVDGDKLKGSMDANGQAMATTGERQPKA
jgi:hypothetical protein